MSSGAKRRCALGVHCVIAALRAHDHTCDDWTEVQESDYTQSVTDLLLKAEGGAGDTLLADDVRRELDYLTALDGGRYRRVVMLVPVRNVLSCILSGSVRGRRRMRRVCSTMVKECCAHRIPSCAATVVVKNRGGGGAAQAVADRE